MCIMPPSHMPIHLPPISYPHRIPWPSQTQILVLVSRLCQSMPHIHNSRSAGGQHAVLQTIEIFSVNGGNEFAGCEAEEDTW